MKNYKEHHGAAKRVWRFLVKTVLVSVMIMVCALPVMPRILEAGAEVPVITRDGATLKLQPLYSIVDDPDAEPDIVPSGDYRIGLITGREI